MTNRERYDTWMRNYQSKLSVERFYEALGALGSAQPGNPYGMPTGMAIPQIYPPSLSPLQIARRPNIWGSAKEHEK